MLKLSRPIENNHKIPKNRPREKEGTGRRKEKTGVLKSLTPDAYS